LSKSNTEDEMIQKRDDYFSSNVEIIWEVNPDEQTVRVLTPSNDVTRTLADSLDGGTVLPGFNLPLRDLFGRLRSNR
jgi:Uma2 family endonuclease